MGVVLTRLLAGFAAGLLAWAVMEPSANVGDWGTWESRFILLYGAIVGASIGGLEGFSRGGMRNVVRSILLGAFFGAVGATLGHRVGGGLAIGLFGPGVFTEASSVPVRMIARTLGFAPLGALLGLAVGGSQLSAPRAVQGAIGGLLGGLLGGALFDPVSEIFGGFLLSLRGSATGEIGIVSRAIAFPLMAALIGAMIGLVSRLARRAWLRLELGRNEGREWAIEKVRTNVGRDERADVPLFGDPEVAPLHFVIDRQGPNYVLQDGGTPGGTYVENVRVAGPVNLMYGHRIRAGNTTLVFRGKGRQATAPAVPIMQPVAPQAATTARTLVGTGGAVLGRRFPIGPGLEIGREGTGVRLDGDAKASRRHAVVRDGAMGAAVEDLGSTNGTWVNGHRVTSAALSPGDELRIGDATFRIE